MKSNSESQMPLLEHLTELSVCLKYSLLGIVLMALLSYVWASELFHFLTAPLVEHFSAVQLIGTGPADAFIVKLKASCFAGIMLSSPFTFYQIWKFVAPGLHPNERVFALPFVFVSSLCFIIGALFCFFVVFPFAFEFFMGEFHSIGVSPTIKIGEYLSFVVKLVLVFGVLFEMPVMSFFLARFKLITHQWLIDKARYAVVVIFIVAAILTPPDAVTQVLLAVPLCILYAICILVVYYANPESGLKARQGDPK
ncbi:MAG: twin-arginine translocase subunit TatC [Deltaproteobacteria bacterium]|nr:twin-arginine translocase subunit TatC [Deltaproteobacteria bacterium]